MGEAGKIDYLSTSGLKPAVGEYIIVEAERGLNYGQVVSEPEIILDADITGPLRKIVRIATKHDLHQIERSKQKAKDALEVALKKVRAHNLQMKLVDVEYSFDRSKIVFYFTAEGRIDFRDLVKDLARTFKARIELKQIGVRDEAKKLGGFGPCGRSLCCAQFLRDFEPVTIKMAKEQNLPLNPTKISGLCGRLMCCLGYEHQTYKEMKKGMPKEGAKIKIKEGQGKVIGVNALKRTATVELENGKRIEVSFNKDDGKKAKR